MNKKLRVRNAASHAHLGLILALALAMAPPRPVQAQQLPLLPPIDPSAMLGMKSLNSDVVTSILFLNTLAYGVNVNWLDFSGNEVFYSYLGPSQSFTQSTYVTHPWLVRDASTNDALVGFLPISEPAQADIIDARTLVTPEPSSAVLLLTGLIGLGLVARRRRRLGQATTQ